jgi:3-dehydroquinate synthetase
LPIKQPADININGLTRALALDKKTLASGLRLILLKTIGNAVVDNQSSEDDILTAMKQSVVSPE